MAGLLLTRTLRSNLMHSCRRFQINPLLVLQRLNPAGHGVIPLEFVANDERKNP